MSVKLLEALLGNVVVGSCSHFGCVVELGDSVCVGVRTFLG